MATEFSLLASSFSQTLEISIMIKWVRGVFILFLIALIAISFSARHAKTVADEYINPIENGLVYAGIWFEPYMRFESGYPPGNFIFNWSVFYCPKEEFCCFPPTVYVSLLGKVKLTNPVDLKDQTL